MIRVLIAEDHGVVREGLRQLFDAAQDIEVVATARDGREAVDLAMRHTPDIVLMDLAMPELDGRRATQALRERGNPAAVVILTSFSDRREILGALDAGAVGYVLKDAEPRELLESVRAAARGESPLSPTAAGALVADRHRRRPADALTEREREVLTLLAQGLPNKRIALALSISEKTVKAHVTRIFQTIGVTDRTQAALWVREQGL